MNQIISIGRASRYYRFSNSGAEKARQLLKAGFLKKAEALCFQFPKKQALSRPKFQISHETANIELFCLCRALYDLAYPYVSLGTPPSGGKQWGKNLIFFKSRYTKIAFTYNRSNH